jgi:hypothetical protein
MFQAGYLTIKRVDKKKKVKKFYLEYPNLEIRSGIFPFLLSLQFDEDPLIAKKHCDKMLKALNNLDAEGVEKSFGRYLSCFAYSTHEHTEGYYHSLFQSAMFLAGIYIGSEGSVGDGRYDLYYQNKNKTQFVIEVKHCNLSTKSEENLTKDQALKKMEAKALEAMKQIEDQQYTKPYRGSGSDIYKVVLVILERTNVLVHFKQEEDN